MTGEALQGFRLSPQQKRLWHLQQEDGRVWRSQCALALRGPLDGGRLRSALRRVTARHEILRTLFRVPPGLQLPVQGVLETAEPFWTVAEPGASFEEIWQRELERPTDPASEVPLRATLASGTLGAHALILSLPTLCADARSLAILVRELGQAYGGGSNDEGNEEVLQYAQFAEWQLGLLEDEEAAAEGREHWARHLPGDAALDRGGRGEIASCPVPLDPATAAGVLGFSSRAGVTPDAVLLAVWQALQARLAGRDGVTVGWGCDGRGHAALEGALGLFSRWLPIATPPGPDASLATAAAQIGAALEEAAGWQEHFAPEGDPAGLWPGFRYGCELRRWEAPEWPSGLTASWLRRAARSERFHLALIADLEAEALTAEIQHDARLEGSAARQMAGWFATLLRHALAAPGAPLAELEILDEAERAWLVDEVNRTAMDVPSGRCLHHLFAEQAARTPEAPAVTLGDRGLTFAELDARANRLAHHLQRLGVGPESVVGLCVERSPVMLVGLLGILKAGGAYLPLDPVYPRERLRRMIGDARAVALVTQERLREVLPAEDGPPAVLLDTHADLLERESAAAPADDAGPGNLAYVLFTSGSTGAPKGVMVEHRSVVNLAAALRHAIYDHHPGPLRVSLNASLAFDASVKQVIQLLAGHTLCVLPDEVRANGAALAAHIARHCIEVLDCTPSQLAALVEAGLPPQPQVILAGGEALPESLRDSLGCLPGRAVYDVYGPTECTVDTTAHRLRCNETEPTLGGPLANVRVYVLDCRLRLVPAGVAGELFVGGAGVSRGYLGRPDLTAERFLPDPFGGVPGERLYRTGDRVTLQPGGTLRFLGRVDHQVKLRGFRIELGEIEAALGEHPQVRQAAVLLREDTPGEPRLAAYVTLRQQHGTSAAELRAFLRERLPEFMVPANVAVLPRLPLTRNGKVDRAALPAPDPGRDLDAPYAPPESRAEQELATLWREVLEVARVGLDDNFFDLGGNSVLMIQLHDRMRRELEAEVSIVELFRHPTVRALARALETEEAAPSFLASEERARRQAMAMQRQRQAQEDRRRAQ